MLRSKRLFIAVLAALMFGVLLPALPALAADCSYHFTGQWSGSRLLVTVTMSHPETQVNAGAFLLGYDQDKLVLLDEAYQDAQSGEGVLPGSDVMALASGSNLSKNILWFNWIALSGGSPGSFTGTTQKEIAKLYFRLVDGITQDDLNDKTLYIPTGQEVLDLSKLAKPLILAYGGADIPATVTAEFNYPGSTSSGEDTSAGGGGGGGTTEPEDTSTPVTRNFGDVPAGAWYETFVYDLVSQGILQGKSATTFAPNDSITRGEFAAIVARMSKETMPEAADTFTDVLTNAWYSPYITWAASQGIAQGSGTRFSPNANITREEMALMLYRYVQNVASTTVPEQNTALAFADESSIATYAKEAVSAMQQGGIIGGKENNRFAPKDYATRAEAAKMISLLLMAIGE